MKNKIRKILYQNSTDDSYHLMIRFEDIDTVIDKINDLFYECEACNGTGLVESMEYDDVYPCLNCLGKGHFN